jgi:hypothetical protein
MLGQNKLILSTLIDKYGHVHLQLVKYFGVDRQIKRRRIEVKLKLP